MHLFLVENLFSSLTGNWFVTSSKMEEVDFSCVVEERGCYVIITMIKLFRSTMRPCSIMLNQQLVLSVSVKIFNSGVRSCALH